jgi:excisionase family DNA binding protein
MTRPRLPIDTVVAFPFRRGRGQGEPAPHPVPPSPDRDEPWLLDSREVARLLGVSRTKAFQLISTGVIPVIRIGRCARVPRIDLEKWVSSKTIGPRAEIN